MADAAQQKQQPQDPPKGLARIPLSLILIRDDVDLQLPQNANIRRIVCGQTAPGRQYFIAHWVPAAQVIELELYKHEKAEPYRTRIVIAGNLVRFD